MIRPDSWNRSIWLPWETGSAGRLEGRPPRNQLRVIWGGRAGRELGRRRPQTCSEGGTAGCGCRVECEGDRDRGTRPGCGWRGCHGQRQKEQAWARPRGGHREGQELGLGQDAPLAVRAGHRGERPKDLEDGIWNSGETILSRRCNLGSH